MDEKREQAVIYNLRGAIIIMHEEGEQGIL